MKNFFSGFEGVLIDMDGVLYDSMKYHTLAWQRMMREAGFNCSRDEFYLYEGMTGEATIQLIFQRELGRKCPPERVKELYRIKTEYFREMGAKEQMPGAGRMLAAFRRAGKRRVLVTGSGQASLIESINEDYPGAFGEGDRVTAHDVEHGKPAPDPYLKGAGIAGVSPERCVVIENAPLGVRAGKAAGCFTIAVTTGPIPREEFEKEGADMIFDSMPEFADWLEAEGRQGSEAADRELMAAVCALHPEGVFVITDTNVARDVMPRLRDFDRCVKASIVVEAGEDAKQLATVADIYRRLNENGATRSSLIVNIGGGVVTDLGGFVAATYQRGMRFINVPTSVLGAADAAIGGKNGLDLDRMKNVVGTFAMPECVIVDPLLMETLPEAEKINGLAEIVKTALIADEGFYRRIISGGGLEGFDLGEMTRFAARTKGDIVIRDSKDTGLRHVLNFGHTAGHAFETMAARVGLPIAHGTAVAHGMLTALLLSERIMGLKAGTAAEYADCFLGRYYPPLPFGQERIEELIEMMGKDKKNRRSGEPELVLLKAIGEPEIGIKPAPAQLQAAIADTINRRL